MQILIFVVTVVMLLSLITYAKLDSYLNFAVVRNQLEKYMQKTEREFINLRHIKWYEKTSATEKEKSEAKKRAQPKGISKLSLASLLSRKQKEKNFQLYNQVRYVFKRLIEELYQNNRFYKQAIEENPNFVDDILNRIEEAANDLPKGQKIRQVEDLSNLDLKDPKLNGIFYRILKGTKKDDSRKEALTKLPDEQDPNDFEDTPVEDGYSSILDYISVDNRQKLRVYLASRRILQAITGNKVLVDEVIQKRQELYQTMKDTEMKPEDASNQFQTLFGNRLSSILNENLLDFEVTKTDPKSYE